LPETTRRTTEDGEPIVNFSSNDYLGLSTDSRLREAATRAMDDYGAGATASRLLAGHMQIAEELENDLTGMMGTEAALVFGSGFLTNLGVLAAIGEAGDEIFSDQLNHASIIDGIRLGRADCSRYRHLDLGHLEYLLKNSGATGKKIIVSESVFSMDGDVAPVNGLADLAARHEALLMIDEAHAIGVMGENGGGLCRLPNIDVRPDIVVGTLSKALGGYGGFVACSRTVRSFLINKARTFLYSTGLPPSCLGSARAAVSIVATHPEMGRQLQDKAHRFHSLLADHGLDVGECGSHIIRIVIGANDRAVRFANSLTQQGLLVRAIRPPTVPTGTARVRLSVTLHMNDRDLARAAGIMATSAREAGILT
jgi:8-amino-7-oxononanoate synthase